MHTIYSLAQHSVNVLLCCRFMTTINMVSNQTTGVQSTISTENYYNCMNDWDERRQAMLLSKHTATIRNSIFLIKKFTETMQYLRNTAFKENPFKRHYTFKEKTLWSVSNGVGGKTWAKFPWIRMKDRSARSWPVF
jgi:hypothetical protein